MLTADDINDTGVQVTLFTDASLAAMFADAIEDRYLFINGLGWHYWTGKRWEPCHDKDVREVARQWTIRLHLNSIEAYKDVVADGRSKAEQQAARQETVQWERYQVKAKLDAITALASGIVTAEAGDCDAHPDLLNCDNGVISLKTGRLRRHDPDLLMTKLAPVNYIPNARHPDWDSAVQFHSRIADRVIQRQAVPCRPTSDRPARIWNDRRSRPRPSQAVTTSTRSRPSDDDEE
jgi:phage/plasmid-associated DNA primase